MDIMTMVLEIYMLFLDFWKLKGKLYPMII